MLTHNAPEVIEDHFVRGIVGDGKAEWCCIVDHENKVAGWRVVFKEGVKWEVDWGDDGLWHLPLLAGVCYLDL